MIATDYLKLESVRRHFDLAAQHVMTEARQSYELGIASSFEWDRPSIESPIEAIFEVWWNAITWVDPNGAREALDLVRQYEIAVGASRYRLDYILTPTDKDLWTEAKVLGVAWDEIAIELDGHDFHERTKEQVELRDKRDRELQVSGWRVFHFSGSELHRKPKQCVQEVLDCAEAALYKLVTGVRRAKVRRGDYGAA